MSQHQDLTDWFQGEDRNFQFTIESTDGKTAQDITGWTLSLSFATTATATPVLTKTGTIQDAVNGVVTFLVNSADTTSTGGIAPYNYVYSVARTNAGLKTITTWGYALLSPASVKL